MATGIVLLENFVQINFFHQVGFEYFAIFGRINASVDDYYISFPRKFYVAPKIKLLFGNGRQSFLPFSYVFDGIFIQPTFISPAHAYFFVTTSVDLSASVNLSM